MKQTTIIFLFALALLPAHAEEGKHLFILSGQSNMRQPLPDSFQETVSKVFGKDNLVVVTHAHPSQPIRRWYKNWTPPEGMTGDDQKNGTLYDALLSKVNGAIKGKQFATTTFIWMQGEADAGSGWGAVYEKSFLGVLDQFKQDLKLAKINFVIGRINDCWLPEKGVKDGAVVRAVQKKLGEEHANGDWVDTDDLNTGLNPWGIYEIDGGHFPNTAYRVLGQRFARKACRLIDPKRKLDERWFSAVYCDSVTMIKTHEDVGKTVTGSVKADVSALLDGKFGDAKDTSKAWITFPPSEEPVELVVDLGSDATVEAVGVNLLFNGDAKVYFPHRLTLSISSDGTTYKELHEKDIKFFYNDKQITRAMSGITERPILVLLDSLKAKGRYIKVALTTGGSKVLMDEIIVNPTIREGRAN